MILWGENGEAKVIMEVRGKHGVAMHYMVNVGNSPDEHCPPKHRVSTFT